MFDIGFWELVVIAVVALLVVGPDRLPTMARTAGLWAGRIRRMVAQVKEDVERELRADEIRRMLDKPEEFEDVRKVYDEAREDLRETTDSLKSTAHSLEKSSTELSEGPVEPPPETTTGASADSVPAAGDSERRPTASNPTPSPEPGGSENAAETSSDPVTSSRRTTREPEHATVPGTSDPAVAPSDDGDQTSRA